VLQALAVADTLVLLIVFVLRSLRYVTDLVNYTNYRDVHRTLYEWMFPCAYILRMVNAWLTVVLTVDRYIAVCRPLHAQRLCTIQRAYSNIVAVTAASVIFCLPRFFENHDRSVAISRPSLGRVKLLSAAGSKKVFAISKWRTVSNVRISLITVSTKNI